MPYTAAQKKASAKWDKAHLYKVGVHIPLEYKERLEELAGVYNKSVSRYVRDLILEQIALYEAKGDD